MSHGHDSHVSGLANCQSQNRSVRSAYKICNDSMIGDPLIRLRMNRSMEIKDTIIAYVTGRILRYANARVQRYASGWLPYIYCTLDTMSDERRAIFNKSFFSHDDAKQSSYGYRLSLIAYHIQCAINITCSTVSSTG